MKSRTLLIAVFGVLVIALVIGGLGFMKGNSPSTPVIAATVDIDCGPADGPAFTISIPVEGAPGSMIMISIWQTPDFKLPVAFSFPDETGQVGNASYRLASGSSEQLSGQVSLKQVDQANPIEGQFDLTSESGEQFSGRFQANWGLMTIPCG
jgi:hypothetical protein